MLENKRENLTSLSNEQRDLMQTTLIQYNIKTNVRNM